MKAFASLLISYCWPGLFSPRKSLHYCCFAISLASVFVQLGVEGFRWQMVPIYIVPLFCILSLTFGGKTNFSPSLLTVLATLYAIIAVAMPVLLPIFTFNKPTGSYKVGTVTYHWTDETRKETMVTSPSGKRELMAQVWYPANPDATGTPTPYITHPDIFTKSLSESVLLPEFLFSNMGLITTHSITGVKLADQERKYPVLLFSHGYGGNRNQSMFQVEELASHGYIVVGIDYVYSTNTTVFPDGRSTEFNSIEIDDTAAMDKLMEDVWVKDAIYALGQIEKLAENDPDGRFAGRIDLNRLGMLGHSFGGATSAQVMLTDDRVKAGMNMDGTFYGKPIPATGFKQPFLSVITDEVSPETGKLEDHVTENGNFRIKLKGARHMSFSDFNLISPVLEWMDNTNARKIHQLTNEFTLEFFDHQFKGKPYSRMASFGDFPDYSIERGK